MDSKRVHGVTIYFEEDAAEGVDYLDSSRFSMSDIKDMCSTAKGGETVYFTNSETEHKFKMKWSDSKSHCVVKRDY